MISEEKTNLLNELGIFMDMDAFTDAIIVPVKVKHNRYALQQGLPVGDYTHIAHKLYSALNIEGHHGIPGEALTIIIPRKKEK